MSFDILSSRLLLIACCQRSSHGPTFTYIGHYYMEVEGAPDKAKRCYRKALDLDITDPEAGPALAGSFWRSFLALVLFPCPAVWDGLFPFCAERGREG